MVKKLLDILGKSTVIAGAMPSLTKQALQHNFGKERPEGSNHKKSKITVDSIKNEISELAEYAAKPERMKHFGKWFHGAFSIPITVASAFSVYEPLKTNLEFTLEGIKHGSNEFVQDFKDTIGSAVDNIALPFDLEKTVLGIGVEKDEDLRVVYEREPKIYELRKDQKNATSFELMLEAAYAELRGVYGNFKKGEIDKDVFEDYTESVLSTIVIRSNENEKTVEDIVRKKVTKKGKTKYAYSYQNETDPNRKIVRRSFEHARNSGGWDYEAYLNIRGITNDVIKDGTDKLLTHYFVRDKDAKSKTFPYWVFERDKKGKLKRDKDGNKIPIEPDKIIEHGDQITRFYYLTDDERTFKEGTVYAKD